MRRSIVVLSLTLALTGCGCVPKKVRESAIAGEARARKAGELVRSGIASIEDMRAYILAEEADWSALRRALEE